MEYKLWTCYSFHTTAKLTIILEHCWMMVLPSYLLGEESWLSLKKNWKNKMSLLPYKHIRTGKIPISNKLGIPLNSSSLVFQDRIPGYWFYFLNNPPFSTTTISWTMTIITNLPHWWPQYPLPVPPRSHTQLDMPWATSSNVEHPHTATYWFKGPGGRWAFHCEPTYVFYNDCKLQ